MSRKITDEPQIDGNNKGHEEPSSAAPSQKRWVIVGVGILAVALLFYWLIWGRSTKTETAQAPAVTNTTGTVKFLMEQQWLIRMKLAKVEEQEVARQITSTGRVIPAANKQALVSPPVSGIIAAGQLPRVGQRVLQGQTIAVIQQTATSAEAAQVRAAAA